MANSKHKLVYLFGKCVICIDKFKAMKFYMTLVIKWYKNSGNKMFYAYQ